MKRPQPYKGLSRFCVEGNRKMSRNRKKKRLKKLENYTIANTRINRSQKLENTILKTLNKKEDT